MEQKIQAAFRRMTAFGQSQNNVLFSVNPISGRDVAFGFGQVQIALAMPFLDSGRSPRGDTDAEPKEAGDGHLYDRSTGLDGDFMRETGEEFRSQNSEFRRRNPALRRRRLFFWLLTPGFRILVIVIP